MKAFVFDVEFMWGFQARVSGLGKSPPSYLFPPPTTVLGALALGYGRRLGRGEDSGVDLILSLARDLLALSFRPLNAYPLHFIDVSRVIAVGSRGGKSYPTVEDLFIYKSYDAPGRGSTFLSSLDERPPRVRYILITCGNSGLTLEDIWSIRRFGSRESPVSVVRAQETKANPTPCGKPCGTIYATPVLDGLRVAEHGAVLKEYYVSPYKLSKAPSVAFNTGDGVVPFLIPLPLLDSWVELEMYSEKYTVYEVEEPEGGRERVVGLAGCD